jgi:benzoyl-CoA reductase/2-hydroxyglutaryl-CoA dehydratase subunit BcrC/BadD/HgdB
MQIAFFDDPARLTQMVNRLCGELEERIAGGVSVAPKDAPRILLTGTPLAVPNWKLHNIIESSGAVVVCEENCTGTRYFAHEVKEDNRTMDEAVDALTERYMGNIHCACFTPNPGRLDDVVRLAREYHADGVIDLNLKFCNLYDTEGYLLERRLKAEGIPVLGLETDYTDNDAEQLRTRVGAFLEMIRG